MKKMGVLLLAALWLGVYAYGQTPGGRRAELEEGRVRADMGFMQMEGLIPMRFGSALDGKPIAGARVEIPGIGAFITDERGIIAFPEREDGNFSLVFSKEGFITTAINFRILLSTVLNTWYSISPVMQGAFRFVLEWGENPSELDIHFEKEGGYHISYRNMRSAADGSVKLDRDDTTGYGPETVTVVQAEPAGVYQLYVIDYTNSGRPSSAALSRSGATVRVYSSDRLLNTFTVPASGSGYRWNVCAIEQNMIVPVNTVGR